MSPPDPRIVRLGVTLRRLGLRAAGFQPFNPLETSIVRRTRFLLAFALCVAPLPAQAGAREAVHEPEEARLAVQLKAGQIWRQNVRFESLITGSDGVGSVWTFDYGLRLRCLEPVPGGFSVAGQFVDWRLRLQKDECVYEWSDGRYSFQSEVHEQGEAAHEACRGLLAAWSSGLRQSELRFLLQVDGSVSGLTGLENLHLTVAKALNAAGDRPPEIQAFFGEDGLRRADGALGLALSVPRPVAEIAPGATWSHGTDVHGLAQREFRIRRSFLFSGLGRERRFRFAEIAIDPAYEILGEDGAWQLVESSAKKERAEVVRILLDSGLLYQMNAAIQLSLPDGSRASFKLSSQLGD